MEQNTGEQSHKELQRNPQRKPSWLRVLRIAAVLILLAAFVFVAVVVVRPADPSGASWLWVVGISAAGLAIVLIPFGYRFRWTGFGEDVHPKPDTQDIRRAKTLWDWLQLLIIPIVLAVGGLLFTQAQEERQQRNEELRSQDAALQAYIDQMGTLLLDRNLRDEQSDDEVRSLARARTLTALNRLVPSDSETLAERVSREEKRERPPVAERLKENIYSTFGGQDRRQSVIVFLYESGLISKGSSVRLASITLI
jgi:hypothetical protein